MTKPAASVTQNTWEFLRDAMITPTGFREYDARWKYPDEINLPGITALGLGLGTQMHRRGIDPVIAVANDYRDYSLSIKNALMLGLMQAGIATELHSFPGTFHGSSLFAHSQVSQRESTEMFAVLRRALNIDD